MNVRQRESQMLGCLLGGALGDALGAPVEILFSLDKIREKFGPTGIQTLQPYTNVSEDIQQTGIGAVTDDTTMCITTLAAMLMAKGDRKSVHHYAWQGYLNWGQHQQGGEGLSAYIDPSLNWSDDIKPFWFRCGAGRGTIGALQTGYAGTLEKPVVYDTVIRGKQVQSPNDGCGGMMRVAPLAFLPSETDKFLLGVENAAITHGTANAQLATGAVCQMVESSLMGLDVQLVFNRMMLRLNRESSAAEAFAACNHAWDAARADYSAEAIDALPSAIGVKHKFLALPVLAQTIYVLSATHHHGLDFKEMMQLAANHSGDSDSVAAIVGNIVGTQIGAERLPQDWVQQIQLKPAIETIGRRAVSQLFK